MAQFKQKISFTKQISDMMFGFGDSHMPNPETVQLVESITLNQLRTIVKEALKYTSDGKTIKGEHLVFLMRHNKHKMRRFVKYLYNKRFKKLNINNLNQVEVDLDEKPKENLMQFIEKIDETGEFSDLSEMDEVKHWRELRADRISQALNEKQYMEFCKARSASFCIKKGVMQNLDRLKMWINPEVQSEIIFTREALEVLSYLAYQTVAEIVDYALLVRMDSKYNHDPLRSHSSSSYYSATMFNINLGFDQNKIHTGQSALSVAEIKEVMRRVRAPQTGFINFGGKLPETHFCFAL